MQTGFLLHQHLEYMVRLAAWHAFKMDYHIFWKKFLYVFQERVTYLKGGMNN